MGALLQAARAAGVARLDAQLLAAHVLARPRTWLLAHEDAPVAADLAVRLDALVQRRARGVPLAYLVGEREFHGLALRVTPDVLVPRPDTETLVDWALELLDPSRPAAVADLGTGSGAIALALQQQRPHWEVLGVDASAAALQVAQANGARLGLPVRWQHAHWLQQVEGRWDGIVSNPPYIRADDEHLRALQHEPQQALVSGVDGLQDLRQIITQATARLRPGGWLLLEHGYDQAAPVRSLLQVAGFRAVSTRCDLAGHERCSAGQWPGD